MKRVAVIMAGGSGERFWPLSRKNKPKQLLNLNSKDKSMIQESIDRISPLIDAQDVFIITGAHLLKPLRAALPQLPENNIIAEPSKRNTAPCLALAAAFIAERYKEKGLTSDEISIAVLTADQRISPTEGFVSTVKKALEHVEKENDICTIGIQPDRPETGYGYIEVEAPFAQDSFGIKTVNSFREKPDLDTANTFLEAGNFLWNSGMFFWKLSTFISAMREKLPEVGLKIADMQKHLESYTNINHDQRLAEMKDIFDSFPGISIDFGLMEKADKVSVAKAEFSWDDIGSWDSLERVHEKDENGNITKGEVSLIDSSNSIVINESGKELIVAGIGMEGMVLVTTKDAIMLCPKARVQEVKKQVEQIRENHSDKWL